MRLNQLQHIQNTLVRVVVAAPKSSNPDHILKSLHWLKVQEHIEYKVISTVYKLLQSSSPRYLRDLITVQPLRSTWSSALVTLLQPSVDSSLTLKITNRYFRYVEQVSSYSLYYQFDPSSSPSSSLSSYSDPGPLVDLSRGVFCSRLKTSFSQSLLLHSGLSLHKTDLRELWPLVVWQSLSAVLLVSAAD